MKTLNKTEIKQITGGTSWWDKIVGPLEDWLNPDIQP